MPKNDDMLLTLPIKRFLQRCVDKAGIEPELLPGEMELARKFSVSRDTIRRAIKELIAQGYVMRIAKRRGLFTNPERSKNIPYIIGVIGGDRQSIFFDKFTARILSGFISGMDDILCQFELICLPTYSGKMNAQEFKSMGIDVLFWMIPPSEDIPLINQLIKERLPIVTVNSPFDSNFKAPDSNYLGFDFAQKGIVWADFFLERNLYKPIYCGRYGKRFECFKKNLEENNIEFPPEHFIETGKDIGVKLKKCFSGEQKIDGIVADGTAYDKVIDFLKKKPKLADLTVLFDGDDRAHKYCTQITELNIHTIDNSYYPTASKAGRAAAKMLIKSIQTKGMPVKEKIIKWF